MPALAAAAVAAGSDGQDLEMLKGAPGRGHDMAGIYVGRIEAVNSNGRYYPRRGTKLVKAREKIK